MGKFLSTPAIGVYGLWTVWDITPIDATFTVFPVPQPGVYRLLIVGDGGKGGFGSASAGLPGGGGGGRGDVKDPWGEVRLIDGAQIMRRMALGNATRGHGYEIAMAGRPNVSALGGFNGQSNLDGNVGGADGAGFANGKGGDGGSDGGAGQAGTTTASSL